MPLVMVIRFRHENFMNMEFEYITADPTGNITVLITSPYTPDTRSDMIQDAFRQVPSCEQVGFVVPVDTDTVRLEMMAYEFCGNASLSAAAWLASQNGLVVGVSSVVHVDSSGTDEELDVHITRLEDITCAAGYADTDTAPVYMGKVCMPVPEVDSFRGYPLISFSGISHLIVPADAYEDTEAEAIIKDYAEELGVSALGMMLCSNYHDLSAPDQIEADRASASGTGSDEIHIRPLVYVPGSGTLVWEHGCATGSTAIGWYRYFINGSLTTKVIQPGGTIRIDIEEDRPHITGRVILR